MNDLIPEAKVDKAYDDINGQIKELEKGLDGSLKELQGELGYVAATFTWIV